MLAAVKMKKSLELINSRFQLIVKSGQYMLGYKQTVTMIRQGKAKSVDLTNNCPALSQYEIKYNATLAKTGVHHHSGNNTELGTGASAVEARSLNTQETRVSLVNEGLRRSGISATSKRGEYWLKEVSAGLGALLLELPRDCLGTGTAVALGPPLRTSPEWVRRVMEGAELAGKILSTWLTLVLGFILLPSVFGVSLGISEIYMKILVKTLE
ncbi:hypothetical protein H8959_009094, partial [Pygathrix nigripes]